MHFSWPLGLQKQRTNSFQICFGLKPTSFSLCHLKSFLGQRKKRSKKRRRKTRPFASLQRSLRWGTKALERKLQAGELRCHWKNTTSAGFFIVSRVSSFLSESGFSFIEFRLLTGFHWVSGRARTRWLCRTIHGFDQAVRATFWWGHSHLFEVSVDFHVSEQIKLVGRVFIGLYRLPQLAAAFGFLLGAGPLELMSGSGKDLGYSKTPYVGENP